jgi:ATP-binding cassette subfamily B protein
VLLGYAVVHYGASRLFEAQRVAQQRLAAFADDFLGTIQGVSTVQAFCVEESFVARLDRRSGDLRQTNLRLARLRAIVFPLLGIAGGVGVFLLLAFGAPMAATGVLSAGEFAAFIALLGFLLLPLRMLGVLVPVFQRAEACLERIHAVFDEPLDQPEGPSGRPFPGGAPAVELRDLSFAYPDAPDRPVLRGIRATAKAGSVVGIYGQTGSGKTTLLKILAGLRNPPAGSVFVDGVDIDEIDLSDLRRHLVMVPQVPFLFSEDIRENVGLGVGEARVAEAIRLAALGPDLAALPQGDRTVVGERGIVLSGGQRQRVTLARALARDGELVLLDDILSAVDHHTEQELIDMLEKERGRSTRFLVSHRMSALQRCDTIWVLDGGRLVAQGSHAELLARPGPYRDAWSLQRETG